MSPTSCPGEKHSKNIIHITDKHEQVKNNRREKKSLLLLFQPEEKPEEKLNIVLFHVR